MDSGDTLDMINHRPISILNGLSKMFDDLNGVVVSNADCQSKGPGFESRVSHGPFQKV
jgi:hypothetical protein